VTGSGGVQRAHAENEQANDACGPGCPTRLASVDALLNVQRFQVGRGLSDDRPAKIRRTGLDVTFGLSDKRQAAAQPIVQLRKPLLDPLRDLQITGLKSDSWAKEANAAPSCHAHHGRRSQEANTGILISQQVIQQAYGKCDNNDQQDAGRHAVQRCQSSDATIDLADSVLDGMKHVVTT
jgi:hypothetical protein